MSPLAELSALAGPWLWSGFLVFLRVGAVAALAPAFGEQTIPARVRLVVALAFTFAVLPSVGPGIAPPAGLADGLVVALAEVLAGLLFGIVIRLFVLALTTAGMIAAQSTSLAQLLGPGVAAEPAPAIGHLLVVSGLALATILGLHVRIAAYLIDSYTLIPAGTYPTAARMLEAGIHAVGHSFALAFSLAAPFVIAALAYNLLLGVINRAMPQMMVTFVGAPVLTAGSLALILLAAPVLVGHWADALNATLDNPFGALP